MLIQLDAKQLEWRVIVDLSEDKTGIGEIKNKLDTHAINQEAFNLPSRLISKIYLFRTIFRGSGYAFAKDLEFSHVSSDPDYWEDINVKFFKKYNGIDKKHHKWAERVITGQPIVGPTGRFWPIPMGVDKYGNPRVPWTTLTNYPVQGTAADIMALVRVSLGNRLMMSGIKYEEVGTVHDSIIIDCPKIDKIPEMMYNAFEAIPKNMKKLFGYTPNVPYECEIKVGNNLTQMEKI